MQVRELMTRNPAVCTPETSVQQVAELMVEHDCGAIPVVDSHETGKPIGIITDRDIMKRLVADGQNPLRSEATDAMTDHVITVDLDASTEQCADLMEENQVRRLVVTDNGSGCCGVVAQADLALHTSEDTVWDVLNEVSRPKSNDSHSAF